MRKKKLLFTVLIVFGLVSPLCAVQVLYEDFEGAAVGDAFVGNIDGWTGSDTPVISDVLLSSGNSLNLSGEDARGAPSDWPGVEKTFSYAIGAGEEYVFSGTLLVPGPNGEYADARLVSTVDTSMVQAALGYGKLAFVMWEGAVGPIEKVRMEVNVTYDEDNQPYTPTDFKIVLGDARTDCYWRLTGNTDWIHAGGADFALPLADYGSVQLWGHDVPDGWGPLYDGGMDNISLEAVSSALHPGDADGDGSVDVSDLGILATYYGQAGDHGWDHGDFTGDGSVDVSDLGVLATNYGFTSANVQAVPEPSSVILLFGLFVAIATTSRRSRLV